MLPILAARAGTIPCQPTPPCRKPGTSWSLRGSTRESCLRPGTLNPWNRTGENSMIRPVQLISQPMTPVKTGIVAMWIQPCAPTCWKNQSISSGNVTAPHIRLFPGPLFETVAETNGSSPQESLRVRPRPPRSGRTGTSRLLLLAERVQRPPSTQCREVRPARGQRRRGLVEGGLQSTGALEQLGVASAQRGDLVLQVDDPSDALETDAGGGELGHHTQRFDVVERVAPTTAPGA